MLKLRLLPSSFESDGTASGRQHYSCYVVNGCVAFDAGSLASGVSELERSNVRDVVITHSHLDHIAGLPLFIDDLFPVLRGPVRVHASKDVIEALEDHIFNWKVYPRFSELRNEFGPVIEYHEIAPSSDFVIRDLRIKAIPVNHKVPSNGFLIQNESTCIAFTGDTAETSHFWEVVNSFQHLNAILIECAFPNDFEELSTISHHLTPRKLKAELSKLTALVDSIYIVNMKPAYRDAIVTQLTRIDDSRVKLLEVGREYSFG